MCTGLFYYVRVSTLDQDTSRQEQALNAAYPSAVHRSETGSGTTTEGREVLALIW
ncbi:MAG: recombinase family protein [Deltaproteobacteria bacterium]|nr:recombinase family protein [Deltaproteobacteria bacterium]